MIEFLWVLFQFLIQISQTTSNHSSPNTSTVNQETHWTPLEAATKKMNEAMIKILMQKLPDPNLHVISLTPS
jgi:hypothetical protein